jgi:multiple sugar transport system permease protein
MSLFGWLVVIAIIYAAVGRSVFIVIDSFARKHFDSLVLLVVIGILSAMLAPVFPRSTEGHGIPEGTALFQRYVIVAFAVMLLIGTLVADLVGNRKLTWQDKKRRKELSRQIKLHLALVTGAIVFSVPFYWLVTTSLKPDVRTNQFPPDLIPMKQSSVSIDGQDRMVFLTKIDKREVRVAKMGELEGDEWQVARVGKSGKLLTVPSASLKPDLHPVLLWSNYSDALGFLPPEYNHGLRPLWNTIYVTILVILGTVLSSSLVAFSFARLKWPGRDVLFVVLIATMMIPPAVTMLPVFLIFRALNWIDTLRPLWVPALFGSAFNVFLLRQFFMTIPNDLEDAAKIDGCSYFTIYWKIMLPLIKPALAAITIFAFMGSWNNFMGPLIYISSPEKMTLAYALQLFQGMHGGEPAMMMAAATLVMLPVLGVFFFTQRYMIQGVTLTGIKG